MGILRRFSDMQHIKNFQGTDAKTLLISNRCKNRNRFVQPFKINDFNQIYWFNFYFKLNVLKFHLTSEIFKIIDFCQDQISVQQRRNFRRTKSANLISNLIGIIKWWFTYKKRYFENPFNLKYIRFLIWEVRVLKQFWNFLQLSRLCNKRMSIKRNLCLCLSYSSYSINIIGRWNWPDLAEQSSITAGWIWNLLK